MNTNRFTFVQEEEISVVERKKQLRRYMKERRSNNENRDVKEENMINAFFENGWGEYESYFVYLSFSSEAKTDRLIEKLLSLGKKVYCPKIENGEMQAVEYGEDFSLSNYGIREPIGENFLGKIDVIVAPLLAVDRKGVRLGYGGGYYDRFIACHENSKRVGWCYDFQIVEKDLPKEEWDRPLNGLITDKRTIKF